jgi:nucleotide-binding universal stress UspA family protein
VRHFEAKSDPRLALLRPDADLLVIGPRGGGLLKTLHLGSTAESLLHLPPAPLLIARAPRPVSRVLLCADGSAHARRAAEALAGMPWLDEASVWVLGVEDGRSDLDRGQEEACALLEKIAKETAVRRTPGPVPWAILEQADELEADLIVMGTRGILGIRRLVVGSTASAVVRAARSSVLAVCDPGSTAGGG